MSTPNRRQSTGIERRTDARGNDSYRGTVYDPRTRTKVRGPWVATLADARGWRIKKLAEIERGQAVGNRGPTIREAVDTFCTGIADGSIINRSGDRFKPSTARGYRSDLHTRVVPEIGATRLNDLTLPDVQRVVDGMLRKGLAPGTVRNTVMALRSLYGWAQPRGLASRNPTEGVRLPAARGRRERIASVEEATLLIAALRPGDRQALALACLAGLRAGELLALGWDNVDLDANRLAVVRSWDPRAGFIEPKTSAATRTVPITKRLHTLLDDLKAETCGVGLPLPSKHDKTRPMSHSGLIARMKAAHDRADLQRLGLHEGRHTFASLMIRAGVDSKRLTSYMGHASITTTFEKYGHLLPDSEDLTRSQLDALLEGTS